MEVQLCALCVVDRSTSGRIGVLGDRVGSGVDVDRYDIQCGVVYHGVLWRHGRVSTLWTL